MKRAPKLEGVTVEDLPFPADVIVETTSYCNLSCIICPYPTLKRAKGSMDFKMFKKIVDEVAVENPSTGLWVAIMGEPLLESDRLIEMLRYAMEKGLKNVNLNTNARFLSSDVANRLLSTGLSRIIVSLDALTKETYDRIRVGGDFDETVKNIEGLLDIKEKRKLSKPDVIVQFIVMDENEKEADAFREHWIGKGAVVKLRLKLGWGDAVATEDLDAAGVERNFPCPWLLRTMSIHWDGSVAQCDADYEGGYSPGDIKNQSLKEVWNGELRKRRERHWALDFSHPLCKNCKDWSVGRSTFYHPNKKEE